MRKVFLNSTYLFLFLGILFGGAVQAQPSSSPIHLTEKDLIQRVQANNNIVQASVHQTQSHSYKTGYLKRSWWPKLSLSYGHESFRYVTSEYLSQPYFMAELEMNLFNGGQDHVRAKALELNHLQAEAQQKVVYFEQLEEARKLYWTLVYIKNHMKTFDQTLVALKKLKSKAVRRVRSGLATDSDRLIFEIKEEELRQEQVQNRFEYLRAEQRLKIILGFEPQENIIIAQSELHHDHDWEEIFNPHSEHTHDHSEHDYILQPQVLGLSSEKQKLKLMDKRWWPRVDAYAGFIQNNLRSDYDRPLSSDRQQTVFGLRASWDLDNLWQWSHEKNSALSMAKAQEYKLKHEQAILTYEVHAEVEELRMLDQLLHGAQKNITRTQRWYRQIEREYDRGVKNSEDMLSAIEKLMAVEIKKNTIIKDFQMAKAHLMTKFAQ